MTTLTRLMAITALYQKPNTSRKASGHKIYPYLLRTLPIMLSGDRVNPSGSDIRNPSTSA